MEKVQLGSLQSRLLSKYEHVERAIVKTRTQPSNPVKEGNALLGLVVLADGAELTGASSKPPRRSTSGSFCFVVAGVDVGRVRKEEPAVVEREGRLLRERELDLRTTVSSSPAVYSSKSRRLVLSLKPPELPPE